MPKLRDLELVDFEDHKGRPYEFSDSDLQMAQDYAFNGMSLIDLSEALCISLSTLQRHLKKGKVLAEGIEGTARDEILYTNIWYRWSRGRHAHKALISSKVMAKVREGNVPVLIQLAKSRLGWSEANFTDDQIEALSVALPESEAQELDALSDDELATKVNEALNALI